MATHSAAISNAAGSRFEVAQRATASPGPGELLVSVKAIGLNPADGLIRNLGIFVQDYPTVLGFDFSGVVIEAGVDVPADLFTPDVTRVAGYAAAHWNSWKPDYGAFQENIIVPWQHVARIPDPSMSWEDAAVLPVATAVALSAWDELGLPRLGESTTAPESAAKKEALLVWGASSSVGSLGVQTARLLKQNVASTVGAVYATAGPSNLEYIQSLGADRVFSYRDANVVDKIVKAARTDGLIIRCVYLAMGDVSLCQQVLQQLHKPGPVSRVASAPMVPPELSAVDGVEVVFIQPSSDAETRHRQFQYWLTTWLSKRLEEGSIRPSPPAKVVGRSLESINENIDVLMNGVSCQKLIVKLD